MSSFLIPRSACLRGRPGQVALAAIFTLAAALVAGCDGGGQAQGPGGSGGAGAGGAGQGGSTGGGDLFGGSGGTATSGGSGGAGAGMGATFPPGVEIVQADKGAYALGDEIGADGGGETGIDDGDGCNILVGVVRDFQAAGEPGGHPDFQSYGGSEETTGLVGEQLGADDKPAYTAQCEASLMGNCPHGQQTTSEERFSEWYRFAEGTNRPYLIYFQFEANGGVSTFESTRFFPLDNAGWGNSGEDQDNVSRNFHFTTELHTKFEYKGGETFRFSGDDDLWVFINGRLAIDLGGLHPSVTAEIDLDQSADALGIEKGQIYSLALFHAERHTSASNFRVDTNLAFVDCGEVLPDPK
jgi:fibro-slime domain-containing protein